MTAILISGSRDWQDMRAIAAALSEVPGDSFFIHGDCRGADKLAAAYCRSRMYEIAVPYSSRHGVAGGPLRNSVMLDVLLGLEKLGHRIAVYAFPMPSSRGTWDLVRQAEARSVTVHVTRGG